MFYDSLSLSLESFRVFQFIIKNDEIMKKDTSRPLDTSRKLETSPPTSAHCGDVFWASCEWSMKSGTSSNSSIASLDIKQSENSLDCKLIEAIGEPFESSIAEDKSRNSKKSVSYISFENGLPRNRNEMMEIKEFKKHTILESNRLEDVIQCAKEHQRHKLVVTSANYPFHIEWVSSDWTKLSGWSSEEVLGLDCKFLQGDATDKEEIARFMGDLLSSGGNGSLNILNYNKDNTLVHNIVHCIPLVDNCGPKNAALITHICAVLIQSNEEYHPAEFDGLLENMVLEEVGMPLDRREGCHSCKKLNSLPVPGLLDWLRLTDGLPLSLMLRYMLRSQAPIILTDRNERIVHVNVNWVSLTGHSAADCDGSKLLSLLFEGSEIKGSSSSIEHDAESLQIENKNPSFSSDRDANYLKYLWPYRHRSQSPQLSRSSDAFSSIFSSTSSSLKSNDSPSQSNLYPPFCISDRKDSKKNILPIPMKMYPVSIGSKHFAILCVT